MLTLEEFLAKSKANDAALLSLAVLTVVCCAIAIYLWRKYPPFARVTRLTAPIFIPILAFPGSITMAVSAAGVALLTRLKITLPRSYGWAYFIIGLVAVVARFPKMSESFWYDETFSAAIARLELWQLPGAILSDVHPPLYYSIVWLNARLFGDSDAALRIPSLLFGLLAVWLIWRLTNKFIGPRGALVAAFLMAVMPGAIYYSSELRAYSLLTCVVFGALICLFEDRPRLFALLAAMFIYVHNLGVFYLAVIGLLALIYHWNWRWFVAVIVAGLIALVWVPFLLFQSGWIADGFWIYISPGFTLWPLLLNIRTFGTPPEYALVIVVPTFAIIIFALYSFRSWFFNRDGLLLIAVAFGVPAVVVLVSVLWHPVFLVRAMLPAVTLLIIPMAHMLTYSSERRLAWSVIAPHMLIALVIFYTSTGSRWDYRDIIPANCAGATVMLHTSTTGAFIGSRYFDGREMAWVDSRDMAETVESYVLPAYGFHMGDIESLHGETVCLMVMDNPMTQNSEREYVDHILERYSVERSNVVTLDENHSLVFYLVEV